MTALSRPLRVMLEGVFATPTGSLADDIERFRSTLTVALRRCLDAPEADWAELVARGTDLGDWDEWRVAGLLAASPGIEPDPATRETLAELVDELVRRGQVGPCPLDADDDADRSPEWLEGRRRRELIFAIERAVDALAVGDSAGLRGAAVRIVERDPDGSVFPTLALALVACADDLELRDAVGASSRAALAGALAGTPFAASVAQPRPQPPTGK
ncbi:MAG: hypothetical protein ACLGHQ_05280 [Acidimicrobiia bacterium]